ncbi:MAG: adenine phosphoribosyltransferase [Pseudomonadota bacterium]
MNLRDHIRGVPDFPKPGIYFYDISTLLAHPDAWRATINQLIALVEPMKPDILAGVESRGFLVAAPLALQMGLGFTMIRKKGKLPGDVVELDYDLEYGSDTVQIQTDAVQPGQRVVILDDLLATGGTLGAAGRLVEKAGGTVVGAACIIELTFLNGRNNLSMPFETLVKYES